MHIFIREAETDINPVLASQYRRECFGYLAKDPAELSQATSMSSISTSTAWVTVTNSKVQGQYTISNPTGLIQHEPDYSLYRMKSQLLIYRLICESITYS